MKIRWLVLLFTIASGCATVGSGQAGVVWRTKGGTVQTPLGEGWHYIPPFDELTIYDLRTQERNEKLEVISSNGLTLALDTTIRYHVLPREVAQLHEHVGPNYYDVILGPVLRSQARRVVGRYKPEEIYSTRRELIEREMREAVEAATIGKHVALEAILVRNVALPDMLQRAIVDKMSEEQRALKMKYVLDREREEAERKKIEAQGIAAYQDTVSSKLSDPFLRWKQIDAMAQLALSPNAKVVMLGTNPSGPLVLETPR